MSSLQVLATSQSQAFHRDAGDFRRHLGGLHNGSPETSPCMPIRELGPMSADSASPQVNLIRLTARKPDPRWNGLNRLPTHATSAMLPKRFIQDPIRL